MQNLLAKKNVTATDLKWVPPLHASMEGVCPTCVESLKAILQLFLFLVAVQVHLWAGRQQELRPIPPSPWSEP